MKTPLVMLAVLTAAIVGPMLSAEPAPAMKATFVDANSPAVSEVRQYGEYAINRIGVSLLAEVNDALEKMSPEAAVDVCHLKYLKASHGTLAGLPRIATFKLTSLKVRNPADRPDAAEQIVLEIVRQQLENGDSPAPLLVQRVEPAQGPAEWRVYKPLGVMSQCLACHGDPASQSPALQAKLKKLYPNDEATGYQAGEWRGMIRVTVSEPKKS
ncbi:MAG: DUF3365 domain-containing protein [Opitutales bacterium]